MRSPVLFLAFGLGLCPVVFAQNTPPAAAPAELPGKGLLEHDFLYAGENKERNVYLVSKGKVTWSYEDPTGKGEISDAVLLSNGNVLIAHQFAIKLIAPDKTLLWNYDAPLGSEIHTAVPIGNDHVLYVQNGDPALVRVVNFRTGETKIQFELPVKNARSVHGQFRHCRLTAEGRLLVAHMDLGKISEYDSKGVETWSYAAPGVWGVEPLKNGNVLITSRAGVEEITRAGERVMMITPADLPDYKLSNLQLAWRLPNGHTVLNNWLNAWSKPGDIAARDAVQALEVGADKKVVWALRSWTEPNLGPATTLQFLDTPNAPEAVSFGDVR